MTSSLLQGKTAIVTGAGSGMGRAIAHLFAEAGGQVVIADLNQEAAEKTANEIGGSQVSAVKVDVADDLSVANMVKESLAVFGELDILVNCAGIPQVFTSIDELSESQWDKIMNINAKSIFLTVKYVVPYMKKKHSGSIVNIASIAGVRARPGLNAYCASKGAAIMLTKALALELAPFQIRVNAINPGPAETPMLGQFISGDQQKIESEKKSIFLSSIPLGSLIQPEDIAQAALYLCSDLSGKVTGEILNVDGGRDI